MKIGKTYKTGESGRWMWDGTPRWWEIFSTVNGYNGGGGFWITENWRWNGSTENVREDIRTLSAEESRALRKRAAFWLRVSRVNANRSTVVRDGRAMNLSSGGQSPRPSQPEANKK